MSRTAFYIIVPVLLSLSLLSCRKKPEDFSHIDKRLPVRVMLADTITYQSERTYSGTIISDYTLPLGFPLGGRLESVLVKVGDRVAPNSILAHVDTTNAHNALASALATLRQAEDSYQRVKMVHDRGAVNDIQWVEVETKLTQAQAMVNIARRELDNCFIRAPKKSGLVVGSTSAVIGQDMIPQQTVLTLVDPSRLRVEFAVAENEITNIKNGQQVDVRILAGNHRARAVIREKNMLANPLSHSYTISADLQDSHADIMPGMVCQVTAYYNPKAGPVIIPATAIHTRPKGTALWVAHEGKAQLRYITIDSYQRHGVAVSSGLRQGDTIIIEGCQKMYEDCPIKIQ